jgi:hypothetical protein
MRERGREEGVDYENQNRMLMDLNALKNSSYSTQPMLIFISEELLATTLDHFYYELKNL